ncbi:MAG: hypothetical protein LBQ00_07680 [Syntrophobacterales bacterium]|jgi:hypothetical protein|nr:hypothetical protein [Syntrophobacterales bacterium]
MLHSVSSGLATLEKKIYQLVVAEVDGDRISELSYQSHVAGLMGKGVSGFVFSGGTKANLKSFAASLRALTVTPLFIACKLMDGTMGRMRGFTEFPSLMALAAAVDLKKPENLNLLRCVLNAMAREAMDCGMNVAAIPASLAADCCRGVICKEGSSEAGNLAWIRTESIRIFEEAGLLVYENSCLSDRRVFCRAVLGGCQELPCDPASVVFDDVKERTPAGWFEKDVNILIVSDDPDGVVRELAFAVTEGRIAEEWIDRALVSIGAAKSQQSEPSGIKVDQVLNECLSREISEMAVTLVKGKGRFFPLRESDNIPLIYAGDEAYFQASPLRSYVKQASHAGRPLHSKERPAMFLLFGDAASEGLSAADSGNDAMKSLSRLIRATSPSVVVSFGSPHVLSRFKDADVLIAAYDSTGFAQEAVFKCVIGERRFEGRLPVTLNIPDKRGRQK